MVYLYAITDRPKGPLPQPPGLMGGSLLGVAYRQLGAVVSRLSAPDVPLSEENIWRHEAVIEALMADRAVLPVRFGTVAADEAAVETALAERYHGFLANLVQVRGHVELGLRILWDDGHSPAAAEPGGLASEQAETAACGQGNSPFPVPEEVSTDGEKSDGGRAYLMTKLKEERERRAVRKLAEALAEKLQAPLARLATQTTCDLLLTPRLLLKAAYLVRRDRVEAFLDNVERLSSAYRHVHVLCTGPWPPYNFVATHPLSGNGHGGADA